MYTHAYAHENTCACMTPSTRWNTDTKTHNLCTNMHTHTNTHMYKRIDVQIHTHMHRYTYIMSAHIHTYTYIHTRIQIVHMHARKARLKRWRRSDCAGSPAWRQEALPFSLSAAIRRGIPFVASTPIVCPQETTDKRRATTTNSSSSHHHDSAPSRPHSLICTGAEPFHPVHASSQLGCAAVAPRNEVIFLPFWRALTRSHSCANSKRISQRTQISHTAMHLRLERKTYLQSIQDFNTSINQQLQNKDRKANKNIKRTKHPTNHFQNTPNRWQNRKDVYP